MGFAPLTTDDGLRVGGPAPPWSVHLATYDESTDLHHLFEETRKLHDLIGLVKVLG